jgi:adenosylcobinamide-phosphate synthase
MIAHREPRFLRFGAFAARTDDVLNFIPARIAAIGIALAGGAPARALRVARSDAGRHASPNAGWPEAALAAVLGVRLGGRNTYAGVAHDGALLNAAGRPANAHDIRRAMRVTGLAMFAAEACAVALRA